MAGIGIRLNKIFNKNSIAAKLFGFGYSMMVTIAPMIIIIAVVILMQVLLEYSKLGYATRELYSCTVLYIFIFALMAASPFTAVISKFMSDLIYEEKYDDIPPCFYMGLVINLIVAVIPGVAFCIHENVVGEVPVWYVFMGFAGYISLLLAFYIMLYLSICKDYKKISSFYIIGMVFALILSLFLHYVFKVRTDVAMLLSLDVGIFIVAVLEYAQFRQYFKENSGNYAGVIKYFGSYWQLIVANFLYICGLYCHNFVFWTTDYHLIVAKSFVCMQPYDMASCIAMFTNISSSIIFLSRIEMNFHERYKQYSEAVIGGRGVDIDRAKNRMFRQLMEEVMSLVRIQFIVTVGVFLLAMVLLPRFGFGGKVMIIYPCLAAGYFIMFIMYALIIFMYYYNDLSGAVGTSLSFFLSTVLFSFVATKLPMAWYGLGLVIGSFVGFSVAYFRLRYMEKHLDVHIFCNGSVMKKGSGKKPSNFICNSRSIKS